MKVYERNAILETHVAMGTSSRKTFTALAASICLSLLSTTSSTNTGVLTELTWSRQGLDANGEIPEVRKLGRGTEKHEVHEKSS